jgi:NADH-quinone oxidoreductase subunit I
MTFSKIKDALTGLKSLAVGLGITGQAFCAENVTVIYPQEQVDNLSTYRGPVELVGKEDAPGVPKCVACGVCGKACPSNCLTILSPIPVKDGETNSGQVEMGPAPQKGAKSPGQFILDFSLCSLCGQCVRACAHNALRYSNDPYIVSFNRKDFNFDLIERLRRHASDAGDGK